MLYIVNVVHLLVAFFDLPSDPVAIQVAKDVPYEIGPSRVPTVLAHITAQKVVMGGGVRVGGHALL